MVKSGNATGGPIEPVSQRYRRDLLQMNLMDDAGARGKHCEPVKGLFGPFQEAITFGITLELALEVFFFGVRRPGQVDLQRMIDHQRHRHSGIDARRITTPPRDRRPQRRKVDQHRHTGGIRHHDTGNLQR